MAKKTIFPRAYDSTPTGEDTDTISLYLVVVVGFSYTWLSTFIHIIYIMAIVYLNMELFIDVCDGELLMWNLTRGICARDVEDICAGIQ